MEEIKRIITIDLAEYGKEGIIEMRSPSLRKQNEFKNAMGKFIRISQGKRVEMSDTVPLGDLEIAMAMQYVYKAPFRTDIQSFLTYTDDMEPEKATALLNRLNQGIQEIDESSPFGGSPSAENASSD